MSLTISAKYEYTIFVYALDHNSHLFTKTINVCCFKGTNIRWFQNWYAVALVNECTLDRVERIVHVVIDGGVGILARFVDCGGGYVGERAGMVRR